MEPALPLDAYYLRTIGGSGLPRRVVDTRFPALPNGPFDVTKYISVHDYAGNAVHRFFQEDSKPERRVRAQLDVARRRSSAACRASSSPAPRGIEVISATCAARRAS